MLSVKKYKKYGFIQIWVLNNTKNIVLKNFSVKNTKKYCAKKFSVKNTTNISAKIFLNIVLKILVLKNLC